jgi:predicted regulator of Ras-like GTPase activity (Roadblock/LC7/MglB family)
VNAPTARTTGSTQARSLRWLLDSLVEEVVGILSVAVVSSDGLLLLSSDPDRDEPAAATDSAADTAANAADTADAASTGGPAEENGSDDADTGSSRGGDSADLPARGDKSRGGPRSSSADLATLVSGLASLTIGAAKLMEAGGVRQTVVAMDGGSLFVTSISDGSLLGVHATADCDMSVIAYHMALFVGRAGHVLTPELRTELRTSMELDQ